MSSIKDFNIHKNKINQKNKEQLKVNVGNQNYNIRNLKESVSPKINSNN